ncbi:LysR family transcriptional regulator [Acinetobacter baumannii]|uniref:LysR family transcriptional regulator n=1 Tax=Acinetobacter baumannii TaxID=470 RepID=UPI002367D3AD|nr:LysR family transcriptional regulator [Acinetobacter baumannii]MDD7976380.1 LysR family transcriptional regulator [Acinetobacter baumannii]MDO8918695.1 LysR family transcriptional regulator [Acinetobacter baumannii]
MNNIHNLHGLDLSFFHRIDINLYPLFIAIYEQKSISNAASSLNITQSAASHALQRLRQQLEDDVFIRVGNKMSATPFAEQIYPTVKQALLTIQNISQQKHVFDPTSLKSLKIAVHDEIEPIILPRLAQHFQNLNLDLQFVSMKLDRKHIMADLATQQLDFVIDLEQYLSPKITFDHLVTDEFVICSQLKEVDLARYISGRHIGVSSRRTGALLEDIYLNQHQKISRNVFMRCQNYSTALQVLGAQADAILTMPRMILQHLSYSPEIRLHSLPFEITNIKMGMFWHEDLRDNLRHQFLRHEIIKLFQ